MKKLILLSALFFILIFISGCGPSAMVVRERPEPPYYVRPVAPAPGYVWIDGNWMWRGNQYVYKQGYWAAPRPGIRYSPGHWQRKRKGWIWKRGRY